MYKRIDIRKYLHKVATGALLIKALQFSQEIMWRKDPKGWFSTLTLQRALFQLLVAEPGKSLARSQECKALRISKSGNSASMDML